MLTLPNAIVAVLLPFATLFSTPTWRKAQVLLVGAILTPTGPRLGSGVLSEGRGLPVGLVPLLGGSFLSSSCFSAGPPTSFEMPCAFRRTLSSGVNGR